MRPACCGSSGTVQVGVTRLVSSTAPGKQDALVYDHTDGHPMLWASWRKRSEVYRDHRLSRSTLGPG